MRSDGSVCVASRDRYGCKWSDGETEVARRLCVCCEVGWMRSDGGIISGLQS